jgi:signal peptidase I
MKTLANEIFFAKVETEISAGRSVRFKVKGHSMYPLLRDGKDEVTISPLTCDPSVYDIVLFRYRGKHILHRIISIEGDTYTIQGDGIYLSCEYCTREEIIGVVTHIHKNGKVTIGTTSKRSKFYIFCWRRLRFCRRYLLAVLRRVYK